MSDTGWICPRCGMVSYIEVTVRRVAREDGRVVDVLTHTGPPMQSNTCVAPGVEWGTLATPTAEAEDG